MRSVMRICKNLKAVENGSMLDFYGVRGIRMTFMQYRKRGEGKLRDIPDAIFACIDGICVRENAST